MADFAPGIKDKRKFGDLTKVKPKDILTYVQQRHHAHRAGLHSDLRMGTPKTNLFSWVTRKKFPEEGKSIGIFRQPVHKFSYADFQGIIPAGNYGAGTVEKVREGKLLITKKDDNGNIHFTTADTQTPKRYALITAAGRPNPRHNLLIRAHTPEKPGVEKPKLKNIDPNDLADFIDNLDTEAVAQPKIDGALAFIRLAKKDLELLSPRISKRTGQPIFHTERAFGERPRAEVPKELNNSILVGELYGTRDGKTIPPQELGGILNANIANSLQKQKDQRVDLKVMLFDYLKKNKQDMTTLPYKERRSMLQKVLRYLPKGKFDLSEQVQGKEAIKALLKKIQSGKHPLTQEGVVIRRPDGTALKGKLMNELDVFVRKMFAGEGKYAGKGVGGFEYSHTPQGPIAGKVGTGISDELRKQMFQKPMDFINRIARVRSQGEFPSAALRAPALIGMHLDK